MARHYTSDWGQSIDGTNPEKGSRPHLVRPPLVAGVSPSFEVQVSLTDEGWAHEPDRVCTTQPVYLKLWCSLLCLANKRLL